MTDEREKDWHGKGYSFYANKACEYFPCHETDDPEQFNCLFCYCPLYALGRNCGGMYRYDDHGHKICTDCVIPHQKENYGLITGRYKEILEVLQREDSRIQT